MIFQCIFILACLLNLTFDNSKGFSNSFTHLFIHSFIHSTFIKYNVPTTVLGTVHRNERNGQKSLPTWKLHSRKEDKTR